MKREESRPKAVILSAGQGTRLGAFTADRPKCLLPIHEEQSVLEEQLATLAASGVEEALVVVGFGAEQVEERIAQRPPPGIRVTTLYNPFFATADNLVSCWLARPWMGEEFLLLNGDTLFEPRVLERLLVAPEAPLTLVVNEKDQYDADDMKVSVSGGRLQAVGKTLELDTVTGESIGLMRFAPTGAKDFTEALEAAMRQPDALRCWYLSVVHGLAERMHIEALSITGLWWAEVDYPEDYQAIRASFAGEGLQPEVTIAGRNGSGSTETASPNPCQASARRCSSPGARARP
ncbi:MAG: NTP transferase domain-containing protein [Myxococcota bacterium]